MGETMWVLFAIIAAIFAAINRTLMKCAGIRADQETIVFSRYLYGCLPALVVVLLAGIPHIEPLFYPSIVGAVTADLFAISFMSKSLHYSPMSRTVPLLAFTPIFLLFTGHILLGEFPSWSGVVGVIVIVIGTYWLTKERSHAGVVEPFRMLLREKGARYMLGTAGCFAIAGPLFKQSVLSSSPYFCMGVSLPLATILFGIYTLVCQRGRRILLPQRRNYLFLIGLGLGVFGVALTTNFAFQAGLASYVVSVKRLSILFSILIGAVVFKEQDIKRYLFAGSVMLLGAVIIVLFS